MGKYFNCTYISYQQETEQGFSPVGKLPDMAKDNISIFAEILNQNSATQSSSGVEEKVGGGSRGWIYRAVISEVKQKRH